MARDLGGRTHKPDEVANLLGRRRSSSGRNGTTRTQQPVIGTTKPKAGPSEIERLLSAHSRLDDSTIDAEPVATAKVEKIVAQPVPASDEIGKGIAELQQSTAHLKERMNALGRMVEENFKPRAAVVAPAATPPKIARAAPVASESAGPNDGVGLSEVNRRNLKTLVDRHIAQSRAVAPRAEVLSPQRSAPRLSASWGGVLIAQPSQSGNGGFTTPWWRTRLASFGRLLLRPVGFILVLPTLALVIDLALLSLGIHWSILETVSNALQYLADRWRLLALAGAVMMAAISVRESIQQRRPTPVAYVTAFVLLFGVAAGFDTERAIFEAIVKILDQWETYRVLAGAGAILMFAWFFAWITREEPAAPAPAYDIPHGEEDMRDYVEQNTFGDATFASRAQVGRALGGNRQGDVPYYFED